MLGSLPLFVWFVFALLINVSYIPLLAEPQLERWFGDDYRTYKRNVPRWIPRLQPWIPPWEGANERPATTSDRSNS